MKMEDKTRASSKRFALVSPLEPILQTSERQHQHQ
jgi:hypothetical protein